ncbi:multiple inositol polyphosphate phosphatase 1-like isoform X3 [Ostrinia furnacalis]|uniref:multiple inositol polyphosphate phosphatase 1-like isoform X2 n=1 Tax=Ostrinia furnacalis TaxID=93504 RepID=UPI0010399883|nr:multiple inositol polyphosphate phosphatase 1-like isoform X2 [Ostrinia furnacalis]XP_028170812.1 multiple inositol polyphosphate phosphatase 1-like isoform X3 [Ostrinia furnacalis]
MNILAVSIIFSVLYHMPDVIASLDSEDVRNYLGTRTPYRFISNKNDSKIKYPNCKDSKIWMMIRHGTRLPSAKDILGMNSTLRDLKYEILLMHKKGKGELNPEQLKLIEDWSKHIDVEQEKFLAREGQDEMILLAERMHKRFPNAIKNKYNNKTFMFRYTATQRAQQSARYFTIGLFDKKESQGVIFSPANKVDPELRFYKHCDKWQKQVKKNPDTYVEQKLYGTSAEMNKTIAAVSKKLGLDKVLSLGTVNLMYKICGFETSWNKHHLSPWCSAFDQESAEVMEYYHDLKHYWMDGYGHDLTYRQACMAIKTMFDNFSHKKDPHAIFLFAHSGTLLKILTHMHLYKPETPLRGDAIDRKRPWRATNIDCFASNLAFVLYKCKDGDRVLTLHQERIIKLPMCESELCPLEHLKEYFHDSIYNCDYSDMCSLDKDNSS